MGSNQAAVTAIKRHVTGGSPHGGLLLLGGVNGFMWASNKYWQVPAYRVAPLLEKYNLDPGKPGGYQVNGDVRPDAGLPDTSESMAGALDLSRYPAPLAPLHLAGEQAYVAGGTAYLAVYLAPDGTYLGLAADTLGWLTAVHELQAEHGTYWGNVRLMAGKPRDKWRSVAVVADLARTVEPGRYETGEDGKSTWIDPVTEVISTRVVGIMTAVNCGA